MHNIFKILNENHAGSTEQYHKSIWTIFWPFLVYVGYIRANFFAFFDIYALLIKMAYNPVDNLKEPSDPQLLFQFSQENRAKL